MARPIDPEARYRVRAHNTNGYTYASTQPAIVDPLTGERTYRRMHWGSVDESKKFHPNVKFLNLPPLEQAKMIFPSDWDVTELSEMPAYRQAKEKLARMGI